MDTIIQKQLDRVEAALNTLIDSIEAYNPSREAAEELLRADDELQQGVEQLSTHQTNHAHIQSLQHLYKTLDTTLVTSLTTLATTRTSIISTKLTTSSSSTSLRSVPHEELLNYARNLSRYIAPLGYKPTIPTLDVPNEKETGTPSNQNTGIDPPKEEVENAGISFLTDPERAWLDPSTQVPWLPWPSTDLIARSALARSQGWVGAVPVDEEAGTEAQMAPPGVGGGPSDQDGDAAMEGARVAERTRRESVSRPAVQVGHREDKPKVFTGLDLYDPDAD